MAAVRAVTIVEKALEEADTVEALTAALEAAEPFRDEIGVDIINAKEKLERLRRYQKLARSLISPLLMRQKSHDHRWRMLAEMRLKRALKMDTASIDKEMKDHCYGERDGIVPYCRDCSQSAEYQSLCLNFYIECIAVRIKTRLQHDATNGYAIDPAVTAFMTRYVHDPIRTWLDEPHLLLGLPDKLDEQHASVVVPTDDGSKVKRTEAKLFKSHTDAIRTAIANLARCDAATPSNHPPVT